MYAALYPKLTLLIPPAYHPEADRLMTVTMLFLDKYSGTYRTRGGLRAKIEAYLDNEYDSDLKWLNREKDMDLLVDLAAKSGGVVVGK